MLWFAFIYDMTNRIEESLSLVTLDIYKIVNVIFITKPKEY